MTSSESPQTAPEEEGSSLPALLAGVAIIGVAAYLIFGSDSPATADDDGKTPSADVQNNGALGAPGRKRGIQDQDVDAADGAKRKHRLNPALGELVTEMAPPRGPEKIPDFKSKEEELAFWEKRLTGAKAQLKNNETFVARSLRRIEKAETDAARTKAENTHKVVVRNRDAAKTKVEDLEKKLEGLRAG